MAGKLNFLTAGTNLPLADGNVKTSKMVLIEKIEEYEKFKDLFSMDLEVLERIKVSLKDKGFDEKQGGLHVWKKEGHLFLIDGYTRLRACKEVGITMVPVSEHCFESEEEAYKYAISLQVNRRNLDSANLLKNVSFLLGTDFIQNYQGSKAELIGDTLGVCKRTAQRYMSVVKNASDEEKELIDDGQISSYKVYKDHHKKEGNTSLKDDDLTDSLEDDSRNPAPILIRERKKSSKSKYEEEQEKRDAKKVAENRAYIKGLVRSCVTFILGKVEEGFSSNEIEQDEEVKQLLENPFDFRFRKEINND